MKKIFAVLLSFVAICQAEVIPLGISPVGTDAAIGLSPSNEVPAVLNSTGSGDIISGGLIFDTDANTLELAAGYGSAAGFTDLTGPATSVTLNGPAATNENAAVLFDLAALVFPAVDPALGGVIYGSLVFASNAVPDLLNGLDYLNLGTAANTNGEIRGQIIPLLPTIDCPVDATIQCGSAAPVSAVVKSPGGYALSVVWFVNGNMVQLNQLPAHRPPVATNIVLISGLQMGTNHIEIVVTDSAGYSASCSSTITVVDTIPPVISNASATPNTLWPPNHKAVSITIAATATDSCSPATWKIIRVQSNEPVNGQGDGDTGPDWLISGDHGLFLRAERSGKGSGRVYTITLQAKDAVGNLSATTTVTVNVPKSQGHKK